MDETIEPIIEALLGHTVGLCKGTKEPFGRAAALLRTYQQLPLYVKPGPSEEPRCIYCDCTEEHQLHDPSCKVAKLHKLLREGAEQ